MKVLPQNKSPGALFLGQGCVLCKLASPWESQSFQASEPPVCCGPRQGGVRTPFQKLAEDPGHEAVHAVQCSGAVFKPLVLTGTNQTAVRLKELRTVLACITVF